MTGKLVAGNTYTISETVVPKGYVGMDDFQVRLTQDGVVQVVSSASGVSTDGKNTITVKDDVTAIGLLKADSTSTTLLDGSTFTLTGTFADGTTSKTLSPTETKVATLFHQLIASTSDDDKTYTYTLTETVPPEGYQVSMAPKTLRITARGVLQEKVDGTWKDVADDLNLLEVPDEQNSFGLVKTDTDGTTRLSGATYTVSGTFAGETTAGKKTLTSAVDSVSQLTGALVADRDYTITETTPAPGHTLSSLAASYTDAALTDGAMTIRMSAAGELSYKIASGADTWAPVGQDNVFEFKDAQTSFTIAKCDQTGTDKIDGSTFSITPATGTTFADGITDAKSFSPTKDAAAPIADQLVAGGTYTISETAIPAGFVKTDDFQVKVSTDGTTVALLDEEEGMIEIDDGTAIVVSDSPTNIFVTKAGAEGATTAQLAGATFELTPVGIATFADGTTEPILRTTTSDAHGETFGYTGSLVVGSVYKLHESIPPAGYKTAADVYLRLTDTGQLQQSDSATGTFNDVQYSILTVTDSLNSFTFAKADQTGAARTGSTFTLTGMFVGDSAASTLTLLSGTASQTVVGKLVAGNAYTLEETAAPDGCTRMTGKVQITCNSDGTLTLGDGTPSYVTLDQSKTTLTVADPFISVVLSKTSRETGEHLDGCSFTVTGQFVDGTTSMTGLDTELTSKMAGNLYASDIPQTGVATQSESSGQLLAQSASGITTQDESGAVSAQAGKQYIYTVQEVQEPGGYQIEPEPVKFMVDDQGTVYIVADDGSAAKAEGSTIKFSDPAIVTTILKTDANGNALAGATFTLAGTFADGTTSKTFTSGTSATVFDAQLVSKTSYTLTETSAPSGYNALSSPVTFTVDSLGKVTITNDAGGAAKLTSDGAGIIVADTAASASSTSTASASTPNTGDSGAGFAAAFGLLIGGAVLVVAAKRRRDEAR